MLAEQHSLPYPKILLHKPYLVEIEHGWPHLASPERRYGGNTTSRTNNNQHMRTSRSLASHRSVPSPTPSAATRAPIDFFSRSSFLTELMLSPAAAAPASAFGDGQPQRPALAGADTSNFFSRKVFEVKSSQVKSKEFEMKIAIIRVSRK